MQRPALLFLDEPTAGLDVIAATALREDLAALPERDGVTVFLTTHNMTEAETLCSLVAVIREGELLRVGHPDALRAGTSPPRVEILSRGFTEEAIAALRVRSGVRGVGVEDSRLTVHLEGDVDTGEATSTSFASFDGGHTWRNAPLTGSGVDPWVAFGADGSRYASCLPHTELEGGGVRTLVGVYHSDVPRVTSSETLHDETSTLRAPFARKARWNLIVSSASLRSPRPV